VRVRIVGLLAALLLAATAAAACSYTVVVQSPTPGPDTDTAVPIMPTPWPNGTTGTFGLRIDPSLMTNIPAVVGGDPLVESTDIEIAAMDDPNYATAFKSYYVASIGSITDVNWLEVSIGALQDGALTQDFYTQWRGSWFQTACSQADGIASTDQESINDWPVDVATCKGGVDAYTLSLDNGVLVSIMDIGPRRLGRELIEGIN
jgi:hypothetical protein